MCVCVCVCVCVCACAHMLFKAMWAASHFGKMGLVSGESRGGKGLSQGHTGAWTGAVPSTCSLFRQRLAFSL